MTKTKLRVFPAIPRNPDSAKYIDELMRVARFSDRNGFAGILLFAGNDTLVEPWSIAQHILAHTAESSPLIAVNPIYMHPFTVAKFISSFAVLYHRKVYLNMITGTATSDLQGLGEQLSHETDIQGWANSYTLCVSCWPASDPSLLAESFTRRTTCSYARACRRR